MQFRSRVLACVAAAILVSEADAAVVKKVVGTDEAGENLAKAAAWLPYEKGFERKGAAFVCDNGADPAGHRGLCQAIVLNQKVPQPIVAVASSKAEGVSGSRDNDYSIYLDLMYADGTPLYGQTAPFSAGTHDWERREVRVFPSKPVKHVVFYLLLRNHSGRAAFTGAELRQVTTPQGLVWFDGQPVTSVVPPAPRFVVRDMAAGSDFVDFQAGKALGLRLQAVKSEAKGVTWYEGTVTDPTGKDRAITLAYTVPVEGAGWRWLADVRRETPAESPSEYFSCAAFHDVGAGRMSRYPLAAVARGNTGRAIAMDMGRPAFFRVGFAAGSGELYVAYDLGLAPERPSAEFRFCTFRFDAAWGLRGAVSELYQAFPDYFRCRTPQQGVWMPFSRISQVEGWEDFGFKFKEGNEETAWDDAHGILTFRYTEPMTWWMTMPKDMPRTPAAAEAEAKRLAEKGDKSAQALMTSGCYDAAGTFAARMRNEPWCNGAVWSVNSSPGIAGDVTDFKNKWNAKLRDQLYGPSRKGDLDGEYVDSSEGYVTDELDYRRDHFGTARAPLAFSSDTHRPAIFRGLVAWEYVRAIADDVHGMGKLSMANGTPYNLPWLAPWLDVCGTETDWNPGGRWQPFSDAEMLYRRVLCGPKPFCFLMNTNFDVFSYALSEKYMKRCLAYGMFPGYFSADASTKTYFGQPALYNRDRPLFRKYVPLIRRVAEAGWQPITRARSGNPKVYVERWGEKLLTVFNDSPEKQTATIAFDGASPGASKELVRGAAVTWTDGRIGLTLDAEDVAVIELP